MMNNKKAFTVLAIGLCMGASLCACGVSFHSSSTVSETTTDANGNKVTTTTTTEKTNGSDPVTTTCRTVNADNDFDDDFDNDFDDDFDDSFFKDSCAEVAEGWEIEHTVPVSIENKTGEDITGFYMCPSDETSWCNLLDDGETIYDGEVYDDFITLTYSDEQMSFDCGIDVNGSNETLAFDSLDISDLTADGFTLTFVKTAQGYGWHIDAAYVC